MANPACEALALQNELLFTDAADEDDDDSPRLVCLNQNNLQLPSIEDVVVCLNSGGQAVRGTWLGMDFEDDQWFSGGDTLRTDANIAGSGPSVYQSARYGNFCYKIPNLPPAEYFVDIHFAEIVFSHGPPGMRVFDVFLQDDKVLSKLDIYARVGANTPLLLLDARATVAEDGVLLIRFNGVQGSPIVCGICVRKASPSIGPNTKRRRLEPSAAIPVGIPETDSTGEELTSQLQRTMSNGDSEEEERTTISKMPRIGRKRILEYERKIEALTKDYELVKNECHEAWMSLDASNCQLEKLRSELDNKTMYMQSLDQAHELIRTQFKKLQGTYEEEKKIWVSSVVDLHNKILLLKKDYIDLSEEARLGASAIPGISRMTDAVKSLLLQCEDLKKKYNAECVERKLLYNKLLELKGNIRVFCRCRPLSPQEIAAGVSSIAEFDKAKNNEINIRSGTTKKLFKFDRVFSPHDEQDAVFADTAPVAVSVLDGYNVCIFAYGQTGTGKTFTMEGTCQNRGVNYRTVEELFRVAHERKDLFEYDISVSVLEVYNEQIRDLLASPPLAGQAVRKLEIKQVAEGINHVPGIVEAHVNTMNQVWDVLQSGSKARAVGATNANEHSSRSHWSSLLSITVKGTNIVSGECTRSKLWLVDLAGSERIGKTEAQGERLKEAQAINKSLSALGDVISALAAKNSHIPYRNSKLTHLLQDSIGGDSKTLMFVQISPNENDLGETASSLNFASRVRGVELGAARKHVDMSELSKYKQLFEKAKQDAKEKDETIKKLEEYIQITQGKLRGKDEACKNFDERIKELEARESCLEEQLLQQKHEAIERMQYSEKLKIQDEMCRSFQDKVRVLEAQVEAKTKANELALEELKIKEKMCKSLQDKVMALEVQSEAKSNDLHTHTPNTSDYTLPVKTVLKEKQQISKPDPLTDPLTDIKARVYSEGNITMPVRPSLPRMDNLDPPLKENKGKSEEIMSYSRPLPTKRKGPIPTFGRATAASQAKSVAVPKNELTESSVINKADGVNQKDMGIRSNKMDSGSSSNEQNVHLQDVDKLKHAKFLATATRTKGIGSKSQRPNILQTKPKQWGR